MDRIYHNGNSDITLNQIYTFIVVAEYGNFTRASAELHISQPSISKTISKLEEATGMNIFIRNPRGALLTSAGKVLYKEWKEALNALQLGYEKSCSVISEHKSLKIGTPVSLSNHSKVFSVFEDFALNHDEIEFNIEEATYSEIRRGLGAEKYDVIFVPSYEKTYYEAEGYIAKRFDESPVLLVSSKNNPISMQSPNIGTIFSLSGEEYSDYNKIVENCIAENQIKVKQIKKLDNVEDIWISCLRGKGAFLYNESWFPKFRKESLFCTPLDNMTGGMLMVWNRNSSNSQIKILKKYL